MILLMAAIGLPAIYDLIYVGFFADPLSFVVAVLFLIFAVLLFCVMVFGIISTIKRRRALRGDVHRK